RFHARHGQWDTFSLTTHDMGSTQALTPFNKAHPSFLAKLARHRPAAHAHLFSPVIDGKVQTRISKKIPAQLSELLFCRKRYRQRLPARAADFVQDESGKMPATSVFVIEQGLLGKRLYAGVEQGGNFEDPRLLP